MNVLVIGSGGREHAFGVQISKSETLENLFFAPGNAGTASLGTNLKVEVLDFEGIKKAVLKNQINLVLVGPEIPLVEGIVDFFENDPDLSKVQIIGPSKSASRLEGSKDFSKLFMTRHKIPTAKFQSFTADKLQEGLEYLKLLQPPYVLKADGLAAGKGVVILNSRKEAETELEQMLVQNKFGKASQTVVVEEFLHGIELSVFVLSDGKNYKILPEAKDYKRIGEGDTGLNTGGMGAISPVPFADTDFLRKVDRQIVQPTLSGLISEGIPYKGFLFIGLMNCNGDPFVIEYNCRMGDPETEAVLFRMKNDFLKMMEATSSGTLDQIAIDLDPRTAATVVLVSGGYPGEFEKNMPASLPKDTNDCYILHAGTKSEGSKLLTNGGRVFAVTALGNNILEAVEKALDCSTKIEYKNKYFRKDIGKDLMNYNK